MLKRTAKALILTLGLAGLAPTAVQADKKTDDSLNGRVNRLEQQLDRIEKMLAASPRQLQPAQTVAVRIPPAVDPAEIVADAIQRTAYLQKGDKSSPSSSASLIDRYVAEYLKNQEEAEAKRVLGCVLQDLLDCAKGCDEDECKKPTAQPASWIYYPPCPTEKKCLLKSAFGI